MALTIHTLGRTPETSAPKLPPYQLLLLTYLLLNRSGASKATLCTLFWPNSSEERARHALSQLLYAIRKRLPTICIDIQPNWVCLRGEDVDCDVLRIYQAARNGHHQEVVALHNGAFLEVVEACQSEELTQWRDDIDQRVREVVAVSASALCTQQEREHNWVDLERSARKRIELLPGDSDAYGALALALRAQGRQQESNRVVEAARDILGESCNLPDYSWRSPDPPSVGTHDMRFVGRSSEFGRLRRLWEDACSLKSRAAVITGEAGIGKSRLCYQLQKLAALHGGLLVQGRCIEATQRMAYAALGDLARQVAMSLEPTAPEWVVAALKRLSGIEPTVLSDHSSASVHSGDLVHAFNRALDLLCARAPVLLAMDDCQWMDASTADLIRVAATASDRRLMLLLCTRPSVAAVQVAYHSAADEVIELSELTRAESNVLAMHLVGSSRPDYEVNTDAIVARAGGNPFFLIEMLRSTTAHPREDHERLPESIQRLISDKYHRLGSEAQALAFSIAILEGMSSPGLVRKVASIPEDALVQATSELVRAGFLKENAGRLLEFKHDLFREGVYALCPSPLRLLMHRRAALVLRRRRVSAASVALHAEKAGMKKLAWRAGIAAGDQAKKVAASASALHWYKRAYAWAGAAGARMAAADRIASLCVSGEIPPEEGLDYLAELRAWHSTGQNALGLLRCEFIENHPNVLAGPREAKSRAEAIARIGVEATRLGDQAFALSATRQAVTCMQLAATRDETATLMRKALENLPSDPVERAATLEFATLVFSVCGPFDEAIATAEAAITAAEEVQDPRALITAQASRASALWAAGRLQEAKLAFSRAIRDSEELGYSGPLSRLQVNYGVLLLDLGHYDEAANLFRAQNEQKKHSCNVLGFLNGALVAYEQGCDTTVLELVTRCEEQISRTGTWLQPVLLAMRGLVSLRQGDYTTARAQFDIIEDELDHALASLTDPVHVAAFSAQMMARQGNGAAALAMLSKLEQDYRHKNMTIAAKLQLEMAYIQIDSCPDRSYRLASDCLASAEVMGSPPLVSRAKQVLQEIELRGR